MSEIMPYILSFYNQELVTLICQKYGYTPMDALRKYLKSKTYEMVADPELEMWEFSPFGIFDMWENEQVTGTPQTSLYLRRDEYV